MTQNQIAYWNMVANREHQERQDVETHRSNTAKEAETSRSNRATEAIRSSEVFGNLGELSRHNSILEEQSYSRNVLEWAKYGSNPMSLLNPVGTLYGASAGTVSQPKSSQQVGQSFAQTVRSSLQNVVNWIADPTKRSGIRR